MAEPLASRLGFEEAVGYLKAKVPMPTQHWDDIVGQAHDHTFVVAGATKAELLSDLHGEVLQAVRGNVTLDEFRANFDQICSKHGWTDWTGSDTAAGRAWRTKTIYTTNLRTAYAAGRLAQMRAIQHERPYWRYRHNDTVAHPRLIHTGWNGLVLRADDPWWLTHYPPNGWGCRCYVECLSQRDLDREGLTIDLTPVDGVYQYVHPRTGEVHTLPVGIQYGWNHMPGATRDLATEIKARSRWMPRGIGAALRRTIRSVWDRITSLVRR